MRWPDEHANHGGASRALLWRRCESWYYGRHPDEPPIDEQDRANFEVGLP